MAGERARIAFLLPSANGGGAEKVTINLANGLTREGFGVDLVLVKAEGPYLKEVLPSVEIVNLNLKRTITSLPALVCYLKKRKPLAMISALDHTNIVALWARKLSGIPVHMIVTVHNTLSHAPQTSSKPGDRAIPYLIHKFYLSADAIVAVSKGVAANLSDTAKLPLDKIKVIYNPVVTAELFEKAKEAVDNPWFNNDPLPVVLAAGRLTEKKDFSTLIQAFALVRKKQAAHLLILGEGEERPRLEALVHELGLESDVSLPGFASNPYAYMRRAQVFVLSSFSEGLPTVLIEALALGIPVIATDCPSGPREILQDGRFGSLVPVGDPAALAETIVTALSQRKQSTPAEAWEPFTVEFAITSYKHLFWGEACS